MHISEEQLGIAIAEGNTEVVSQLLKSSVDPNGATSTGWTPLMIAVEHENIEIIDLLIAHGAKINLAGVHGQTPLHIAVDVSIDGTYQTGGSPGDEPTDVILCLIGHGADLDAKDNKGKRPVDWAINYDSQKIIELLR